MNANELLDYLVRVDDSSLSLLRTELAKSAPIFLHLSCADGQSLLQIYRVRAKINGAKGLGWQGYEDLLPNLEKSKDRLVSILLVNTDAKSLLVFVDTETSRTLGVLLGSRNRSQAKEEIGETP